MKKLLITGASGFLGWNLCNIAKKKWNVTGTTFSNTVKISGCLIKRVDLTKFIEIKELINNTKPDAVIHTAAASQPNYCQINPDESYKINVKASQEICKLCLEKKIPFLFTSTDLVFDGTKPPYSEQDSVSPISIYGEQKVETESAILSLYPDAIICRMPLMFGDGSPKSNNFLKSMLQNLQNNRQTALFFDEYRTPANVYNAALGILLVIDKVKGIIHLGGYESISRYDFGKKLSDYCKLNTSLIKPNSQKSISMTAPRPKDVSLNSSFAFSLGYKPLPLEMEFNRIESVKKVRLKNSNLI